MVPYNTTSSNDMFGSRVMSVDGFKIQDFKLWAHGTLLYTDSKGHLAKWLRINFALVVSPCGCQFNSLRTHIFFLATLWQLSHQFLNLMSDPAACWHTIAFNLAQCDPLVAKRVMENIRGRKVDLGRADIELHFKYLIEDPLREGWRSCMDAWAGLLNDMEVEEETFQARDKNLIKGLPVVVFDALDECGSDDSQDMQCRTFINTITKWSCLPRSFKLMVTSRNEQISAVSCHNIVLDTGDVARLEAINDV
jgi:hypothetical protein